MTKLKVGLLPLYLKLYIDNVPEATVNMDSFVENIVSAISSKGVEVFRSAICYNKKQFNDAVKEIEKQKVDAIVTLHLAYSPSLESIEALGGTHLPIIVLNTTPNYEFGKDSTPDDIMYNHGIHGVQDMCNLLKRYNKHFIIESGHWEKSDVIERTVDDIKAAALKRYMTKSRTGIIGKPFYGMGDFSVPYKTLKETIGIDIIEEKPEKIAKLIPDKNNPEVIDEIESDNNQYINESISESSHLNSVRIGFAIRKWLKEKKLDSYSINFSEIGRNTGFPTFPFLESSKAMARGIGYAGEGDVLTATLVGALMKIYSESSFTEMFCPDWKGSRIFLSHMGEMNINLINGRPRLVEKEYPFIDLENPVVAMGQFKKGTAVLVNLAPAKEDNYNLIISKVKMVEEKAADLKDTINGWFETPVPVNDFLSEYSRKGGTHHSCLVYGDNVRSIIKFGRLMGWNVHEL